MNRFYKLLPDINIFGKGKIIFLQLDSEQRMANMVFVVDITAHISTSNRTLQGKANFVMIYVPNSRKCFFITRASFQTE